MPVAPNLELGTLNPEHRTQNTERGTRNPEPGTRNPEPGTWKAEHAAAAWALGAALALMPTAALSQAMTDPTRPPAALAAVAPEGEGAGSQLHQLQTVIISPTRKAAIINGVLVELGAKVGDAVLTRVAEDEVVLRSGDSREVLKLHPAVDKVDIEPAGAKSAPRKTKPKAKPKATTQREADPAADGSMKAR